MGIDTSDRRRRHGHRQRTTLTRNELVAEFERRGG
jgi:hypothetical protein